MFISISLQLSQISEALCDEVFNRRIAHLVHPILNLQALRFLGSELTFRIFLL